RFGRRARLGSTAPRLVKPASSSRYPASILVRGRRRLRRYYRRKNGGNDLVASPFNPLCTICEYWYFLSAPRSTNQSIRRRPHLGNGHRDRDGSNPALRIRYRESEIVSGRDGPPRSAERG